MSRTINIFCQNMIEIGVPMINNWFQKKIYNSIVILNKGFNFSQLKWNSKGPVMIKILTVKKALIEYIIWQKVSITEEKK